MYTNSIILIQGFFPGGMPHRSVIKLSAPKNYLLQRKPFLNPNNLSIQKISSGNAFQIDQHRLNLNGSGSQLPNNVRQKMESVFNADFSNVKIHTGGYQAESIGALAFTTGNDIYFANGQYNPHSSYGQRILGHELTHVVQQRNGRVKNPFGNGIAVVNDHGLEAEAERMGLKVNAQSNKNFHLQLKGGIKTTLPHNNDSTSPIQLLKIAPIETNSDLALGTIRIRKANSNPYEKKNFARLISWDDNLARFRDDIYAYSMTTVSQHAERRAVGILCGQVGANFNSLNGRTTGASLITKNIKVAGIFTELPPCEPCREWLHDLEIGQQMATEITVRYADYLDGYFDKNEYQRNKLFGEYINYALSLVQD